MRDTRLYMLLLLIIKYIYLIKLKHSAYSDGNHKYTTLVVSLINYHSFISSCFAATTVVVSLYILIQMWKTKEWVIKPHSIWTVPERHTHLVRCWANRHSTNITHSLPACNKAYSIQRVDYFTLLCCASPRSVMKWWSWIHTGRVGCYKSKRGYKSALENQFSEHITPPNQEESDTTRTARPNVTKYCRQLYHCTFQTA